VKRKPSAVAVGGTSNSDRSFDQLLSEHLPMLRKRARQLCKDAAEAEDLVQDTVVRALSNRESYLPGTNLAAWLMRILWNRFIDTRRDISIRLLTQLTEFHERTIPLTEPEPPRDWMNLELMAVLPAALKKLSEKLRVVFVLSQQEGKTHQEIAAMLGISVNKVAVRLWEARKKLRKILFPRRKR